MGQLISVELKDLPDSFLKESAVYSVTDWDALEGLHQDTLEEMSFGGGLPTKEVRELLVTFPSGRRARSYSPEKLLIDRWANQEFEEELRAHSVKMSVG